MSKKYEKVLVRLMLKGGKGAPKRRFVVERKVIKKSERAENYKVTLVRPGETAQTKLWIGIEDITDSKRTQNNWQKNEENMHVGTFSYLLKRVIAMTCSKVKDTTTVSISQENARHTMALGHYTEG